MLEQDAMFTEAKTRFDAMHARDPSNDYPVMTAIILKSNLSQQFGCQL